jgi:hypothetical protein
VDNTTDNDLWHAEGLKSGKHTLRIVLRGNADSRSLGRKFTIESAISFIPRKWSLQISNNWRRHP